MRLWFDDQLANGPLNGAFNPVNNLGPVGKPIKRHNQLGVDDITGISKTKPQRVIEQFDEGDVIDIYR